MDGIVCCLSFIFWGEWKSVEALAENRDTEQLVNISLVVSLVVKGCILELLWR